MCVSQHFSSLSLSLSLSLMITHEIRSEKNASLACVLQAECKVFTQKSGCHKVNILLDLRNHYVMHMDQGEHSQSHVHYGGRGPLHKYVSSPRTIITVLSVLLAYPVADPGFEEGSFQVCGQSPHGCHRQLLHKWPMLAGSGGMPPRKFLQNGCSETSFPAFWGHLRCLYS